MLKEFLTILIILSFSLMFTQFSLNHTTKTLVGEHFLRGIMVARKILGFFFLSIGFTAFMMVSVLALAGYLIEMTKGRDNLMKPSKPVKTNSY